MAIGDLLFRKQKDIEQKLEEYLDHWQQCIDYLQRGMETYLAEGPGEQIDYFYTRVDRSESRGDELRRIVETELYEKALLPEARGDILRILDALDKVINRAESVIRTVVIERLELEPWMRPSVTRLVEFVVEACNVLHEAARHLLRGEDVPVPALTHRVEEAESRADHLEEDILGRIFASDVDLARKLQLKDFVRRIGTIADLAESASDRMHIVSIKRRV